LGQLDDNRVLEQFHSQDGPVIEMGVEIGLAQVFIIHGFFVQANRLRKILSYPEQFVDVART
jgi:hypothetical protein